MQTDNAAVDTARAEGTNVNWTEIRVGSSPLLSQTSSNHAPVLLPLHIGAGDYLELNHLGTDGELLLPYKHIKLLGHGGSASVDMVEDTVTGGLYARKSFRNVYTRNIKEVKNRLYNEVQIMQRLASHHHFIKLHATIIMGRNFTLVLEPVANHGDLMEFLQGHKDLVANNMIGSAVYSDQESFLHQSYGCLAAGLAFMHEQTVRHKDIKPQNILVHKTRLCLY